MSQGFACNFSCLIKKKYTVLFEDLSLQVTLHTIQKYTTRLTHSTEIQDKFSCLILPRAKASQKWPWCPLETKRCMMVLHTGGYLQLSQLHLKPGHSVCETERRQTRWPSDTDIKSGRKTRGKGDSEGSGHSAVILGRGRKERCQDITLTH